MSFVLERGGMLLQVRINGVETLDGYQTAAEIDSNRWAKGGYLFPFPNRLEDGTYEWQGQSYRFANNDTQRRNALHGLGMELDFLLHSETCTEESATVELICDYQGTHPGYPFPCELLIRYELHKDRGFELTLSVSNQSEVDIPLGMGYHPYFTFGIPIDTAQLTIPPVELIGVDDRMLPTGKRYPYDHYTNGQPIGADVLDNCFALVGKTGRAQVALAQGSHTLQYWQDAVRFPFIQLFTHPDRQSFAVEPMSCNVNAFRNQEGLTVLAPKATWSASFGWTILTA